MNLQEQIMLNEVVFKTSSDACVIDSLPELIDESDDFWLKFNKYVKIIGYIIAATTMAFGILFYIFPSLNNQIQAIISKTECIQSINHYTKLTLFDKNGKIASTYTATKILVNPDHTFLNENEFLLVDDDSTTVLSISNDVGFVLQRD